MEKKMKKTTLAIGFALCIGILTGCGMMRDNKEEHVPRVFGATYMTRNNPYFDVLHEAIEEGVEGNGDILISRDPSQDQERQNAQIMEMIEEGIEVLFLNPVDWEKVKPALEACREAGVVVINIDTVVKDREYVVTVIETDNYQAGVLCAEDMMKRVDSARIVVIDNPIQTSITNRVQGFLDTIAGNDSYQVVYTHAGAGEFEVSADVIAEFLKKNMEFNVVLGGNDPSALGALAALQQYHREEGVLIYGIDGSPDFKAMLELGAVSGTSAQSPKTIGEVAVKKAYDYLNGMEIEPYISIEPYMITKENLSGYEINGWQ
ncbi:sugar ABC transporter substrate-binding protein [Candidatus Merdisoma sp. JLR.KK011]|jgi:ribose transport system substrate-binding protein|uniref:sugar ABC transporter substrate-binding protein n=1 Tax=Candidatus Merdisoma sp. JLR.KK011 TaxID=3114299 RepID=UPI002FF2C0AB